MKKIKLTAKQQKNLKAAIVREQQSAQAFRMAQSQAGEAANHRQIILEMVLEAHGEEMPTEEVKINLSEDGYLTIGENGQASSRIKKELQRGAVKRAAHANKSAKVVPMKTAK